MSNVNINSTFTYSKVMGDIFEDKTKVGHQLDMRAFLRSWNDNSTGKPAIIAIYRTNTEREYSLLSGNENMEHIHSTMMAFARELKLQEGFKYIQVGGTKGAFSKQHHPTSITDYAQKKFTTSKKFDQKPKGNKEDNEEEQERERTKRNTDQWKSPPLINR